VVGHYDKIESIVRVSERDLARFELEQLRELVSDIKDTLRRDCPAEHKVWWLIERLEL
jgi:hypothetical protein